MKLRVDLTLCQGHGVCVEDAPELFELVDGGHAGQQARVKVASVPPQHEAAARNAAIYCPTQAISIDE
jgi:ferredoxin